MAGSFWHLVIIALVLIGMYNSLVQLPVRTDTACLILTCS